MLGVAQAGVGAQRAQERVLEHVLGVARPGDRRAWTSSSSPWRSTSVQNGGRETAVTAVERAGGRDCEMATLTPWNGRAGRGVRG